MEDNDTRMQGLFRQSNAISGRKDRSQSVWPFAHVEASQCEEHWRCQANVHGCNKNCTWYHMIGFGNSESRKAHVLGTRKNQLHVNLRTINSRIFTKIVGILDKFPNNIRKSFQWMWNWLHSMHHSFLRPGTAVHIPATPQREDHESRGSLADSPRGMSPVEPHIFARGSAALFRFRKWTRSCKALTACSRGRRRDRQHREYRVWQKNKKNKMQPTNPNANTYVNDTDVKTHGYAVTQNTFLQWFIWTVSCIFPLLPVCSVEWKV